MSKITLREAAQDLLDARQKGMAHVGYRGDLWTRLKHILDEPTDPKADVIAGVTVDVLLDQCKRLAIRNSGSTMSFQYASAFENCIAVIEALREMPAPLPTPNKGGE
ncbi:hypothetical protein EHH54_34700 [Rhizobium leguminosarum]|uniref:hypothetical protein n=1 Tax=Rhizobium leguminosarum TaxID=384 RepID=UPI000FEC3B64|nr:hypothetical protein [Rhizobium leguminosarum]RWX26617.1 hypothetical protein EHH54_34700 [Rhizobium leguminosarum]